MTDLAFSSSLEYKINAIEREIVGLTGRADSLSSAELVDLQALSDKWSLLVNLESSLAKRQSDVFNRIIDKV